MLTLNFWDVSCMHGHRGLWMQRTETKHGGANRGGL